MATRVIVAWRRRDSVCMTVRRTARQDTARSTASLVELDTPELRDAFADEVADVNRRRLRVIGPIMVLVHIVHAWLFSVAAADRDALTAATLVALPRLVIVHAAM